jgi:hypothetical protein
MTLLPSRKVSAAFIGVFLVGTLVGAMLVVAFQDMRFSHFLVSTSDPKSMAERINQKYVKDFGLSSSEQQRIVPLTQEMTQRLYMIRRQFGVDIIATMDEYHQKIGAEMTAEHRTAFESVNLERRNRMSAMLLLNQPADLGQK